MSQKFKSTLSNSHKMRQRCIAVSADSTASVFNAVQEDPTRRHKPGDGYIYERRCDNLISRTRIQISHRRTNSLYDNKSF